MAKGTKGVAEKSAKREENPYAMGRRVVEQVPFESIKVDWKANPRGIVTEESVADMRHSIKVVGIIQPVGLKRENAGYTLIYGYRRFKCAEVLKMKSVPAIVFDDIDVSKGGLLAGIENGVRLAINPVKEARHYSRLIEDFGGTDEAEKEIARITGVKISHLRRSLSLLDAPKNLIALMENEGGKPEEALPAAVALELMRDGKYLPSDIISEVLQNLPGKGTQASAADTKRTINDVLRVRTENGAAKEDDKDEKAKKADDATEPVAPTTKEARAFIYTTAGMLLEGDLKISLDSNSFLYGWIAGANWAKTGEGAVPGMDKDVLIRIYTDARILSAILDFEKEALTKEAAEECEDKLADIAEAKGSLADKCESFQKFVDGKVKSCEAIIADLVKAKAAKEKAKDKAEAKK